MFLVSFCESKFEITFRDSSTVEQVAVNDKVLGSSPSRGADYFSLENLIPFNGCSNISLYKIDIILI